MHSMPLLKDKRYRPLAAATFNECQAMMSCDDLLLGLINDEYAECQDEFEAYGAACQ